MGRKSTSSISPASPVIDLPGPMAVVCHDAGAANLILAWLAKELRADVRPVMAGPAERLWRQRFGEEAPLWELQTALDGAAALLSGTGWASDLEHSARAIAKRAGIRSAAVLDHWVNYPERFVRRGEIVWPDEYWVVDEDALALASQQFPGADVRLKPNDYLNEQLARIRTLEAGAPERVLYVLEPARSDWGRSVPGEFQALDYWLEHFGKLGLPRSVPIRLRPHPSEPSGKYQEWLERHSDFDLKLDDSRDLAETISRSSIIAGCQSYAMVVALAAGRKVVCSLPPWAPRCALPQPGVIHLGSLTDSDGNETSRNDQRGL